MIIDLRWSDSNPTSTHSTEIWRSQVEFDKDLVGAELIATVGPGIQQYADISTVYKEVYFYRLRFVQPQAYPAVSKLFRFQNVPYTGPGPEVIQYGDENFGYYGVIPSNPIAVPTLTDVRQALGLPSTSASADLHKFTIGGSVRGIFPVPLITGDDIQLNDSLMQILIQGGSLPIVKGLHEWAITLPSGIHQVVPDTEDDPITHFPGELRSMLGVITNLYARVEDSNYGNKTGYRLTDVTGQTNFYTTLEAQWPGHSLEYIATCDWEDDTCEVIVWTSATEPFPIKPYELHVASVDYDQDKWAKTIIWPVLVYTGLSHPET